MKRRRRYWSIHDNRFKTKVLYRDVQQSLLQASNVLVPLFLFVGVALVIYDFGFKPFWRNSPTVNFWMQFILNALSILMLVRILLRLFVTKKLWSRIFNIAGWVFIVILALFILPAKAALADYSTNKFIILKLLVYTGIAFAFITEVSFLLQFIYNHTINPALLFVAGFAFFIVIGVLLLKLPNATYGGISNLDAVFTATSAVCVTGLIVVDTATYFTTFGHLMILVLIQIGGLGIMTFAGLLAYAVAGQTSFKSQLAFKDMMSSREMGNIMRFIYQVIVVTLLYELIGAICIYLSLSDGLFERKLDKIFFSLFHAVSAFCNAGFSTYTNNLYEPVIRFNYTMHFFIAILVILGGLGFPIVFNLYRYIKIKLRNGVNQLLNNPKQEYIPRIISLNSRLALVVSGVLLLVGFVAYFLFEQNATLQQHPSFIGKLVTSFLGSVVPRTAGFNTVDITVASLPTIMIYLMLMWIGASPGSTGGGIKTTTIGVAVLNMVAILRGKDRSEVFRSEISHESVRRAFAIMLLSFFLIGISIFLISINDSDKGLIKIAFEVFSAFSTVGLSLGITPVLSSLSKFVIIITMFIGRVGMITLLIAFIRQSRQLYYRYPKEDVAF
jgi:trk system potassium uptake protein